MGRKQVMIPFDETSGFVHPDMSRWSSGR